MKKGEKTNKTNDLFGIFATFVLALGVGLSLPPKTIVETKAEGEEIALQTNFSAQNPLMSFHAGDLTLTTQVPSGTITVSKDQAQIGNMSEDQFLVMGPTWSNKVSYVQFPFNINGLSRLVVNYKASPYEGAEAKIKSLETAIFAVEKLSSGSWMELDSLDLKTQLDGNNYESFAASLTGAGIYRLAYYIDGEAGEGNNNQAIWVDDLVFYKEGAGSASVVTELAVNPQSDTLVTNVALAAPDYEVTITKDGVSGSGDDYSVQIGTGNGSEFVGTNVIWGVTRPKVTDTTIQFKAYYPTTAGGLTYLSAEVAISVAAGFGRLQRLEITTQPTKTSFYIGETFSSEGLVLTAYDDSDPTLTKEVTAGYTITTYEEGHVFESWEQGPNWVYIEYEEGGGYGQAQYMITVQEVPKRYTKVTSINELYEGAHYLITGANNSDTYVMAGQTSENQMAQTATIESGNIVANNNEQVIQLTPGNKAGTFGLRAVNKTRGFLSAASSTDDLLHTVETLSDESSWDITFSGETLSIVAQGTNTHNHLSFNALAPGGPRFSAYVGNQSDISLWVDESSISSVPSVSITTLGNNIIEGDIVQFNAIIFNASEATITWSIVDDEGVATIDSETGLLTTLTSGSITVRAAIVVEGETKTNDVWIYIEQSPYSKFTKITSVDNLRVGGRYLIAASGESETYVMTTSQTSDNRSAEEATISGGKLVGNNNAQTFELRAGNKAGTFAFRTQGETNGYLAAASSSKNVLHTVNQLSDDASWAITFNGESLSIVSQGSSRRNKLMFEEGGPRFSADAFGDSSISLWVDESSINNNQKSVFVIKPQSAMLVGESIQFFAQTINLGDAPVTWSTEGETSIATINAETGVLTALAPGNIRVKASVEVEGQTYIGDTNIDVRSGTFDHAGSALDPFSVNDAILKADLTGTQETENEYYVQGVISEVVEVNTTLGYATFKLRDEGLYSDLTAYQVKWGADGSDFTSETAASIVVGNEVILVGKLYKYENNTRQLVQNSKVLSVVEQDFAYEDAQEFASWLLDKSRDFETCDYKFKEAQIKWSALSQDAKEEFKTHIDFVAAKARLLNWVLANGLSSLDELDNKGSGIKSDTTPPSNMDSLTATIIIGVIGLTTLAGYYFLKKRQTQN